MRMGYNVITIHEYRTSSTDSVSVNKSSEYYKCRHRQGDGRLMARQWKIRFVTSWTLPDHHRWHFFASLEGFQGNPLVMLERRSCG